MTNLILHKYGKFKGPDSAVQQVLIAELILAIYYINYSLSKKGKLVILRLLLLFSSIWLLWFIISAYSCWRDIIDKLNCGNCILVEYSD